MRRSHSFGSMWPDNAHVKCADVGVGLGAICSDTVPHLCQDLLHLFRLRQGSLVTRNIKNPMGQAQVKRRYRVRIQ